MPAKITIVIDGDMYNLPEPMLAMFSKLPPIILAIQREIEISDLAPVILRALNEKYQTVQFYVQKYYASLDIVGKWSSKCELYFQSPIIFKESHSTFWELMLIHINTAIKKYPEIEELQSLRWDIVEIVDNYAVKEKRKQSKK